MEFAWGILFAATCLGGVVGWIIASVTSQLPVRWNHFMRIEANEYLGFACDTHPRPPLLIFDKKIGRRSILIMFLCVAETTLVITAKGLHPHAFPLLFFAYGVTAAAIVDHEHMILPDGIVQPLLWAGLLYVAVFAPTDLQWHVFGAAVGYCLLRWLPSVGEGDAKLCAAVGAWLGLSALPMLMMVGGGLALASALIYYMRRGRSSACPLGPPLALAALAIMDTDMLVLPASILG